MRHFVFFVLVTVIISACGEINRNAEILPSPTVVPSSTMPSRLTMTVALTETSLPSPSSTPVSSSLILTEFPLAIGAVWKYSAEISYADPGDYGKVIKWNGFVIDKVVDKEITPNGKIIFTVQEDFEPEPPQEIWRQPTTFKYIVSGNGVFKGNMKIYQWPLENDTQWKISHEFVYDLVAQSVGEINTPYGNFDNCYTFLIRTGPDTSIETFCPGIGFVMHTYTHHGTPQDEEFVLSSFIPGQP
jgi:hypothetical protein